MRTQSKLKGILRDVGRLTEKTANACDKIYGACSIWASSGRPVERKKISTTHVNKSFNDEIQVDLMYVWIQGRKREEPNVVHTGTRYGERTIVQSRSGETIKEFRERTWFYRHVTMEFWRESS